MSRIGSKVNKHRLEQHKFTAQRHDNKEKLKQSGIYLIENKINGHRYVGQSLSMGHRWHVHITELKAKRHPNLHLQHAFDHYGGESAFSFEILEFCNHDQLDDREQFWIERLNPEYNICLNVYSNSNKDNPYIEEDYYDKSIETFTRPKWHSWVYGGQRNRK